MVTSTLFILPFPSLCPLLPPSLPLSLRIIPLCVATTCHCQSVLLSCQPPATGLALGHSANGNLPCWLAGSDLVRRPRPLPGRIEGWWAENGGIWRWCNAPSARPDSTPSELQPRPSEESQPQTLRNIWRSWLQFARHPNLLRFEPRPTVNCPLSFRSSSRTFRSCKGEPLFVP